MTDYSEITDKEAVAYLRVRGDSCPKCFARELSGEEFDLQHGTVYQDVSCDKCGATWTDAYELDRIVDTDVDWATLQFEQPTWRIT